MQRLKEIAFHMPLSCSALARDSRQSVCSEPPVEMLSKKPSCVECACLNSGHGQAEPSSRFSTGKALQFPKKNHSSQVFPEMRNRVNYCGSEFIFGKGLFRRQSLIGEIEDGRPFRVIDVVSFDRFVCSPVTQHHERFVDGYACHPG